MKSLKFQWLLVLLAGLIITACNNEGPTAAFYDQNAEVKILVETYPQDSTMKIYHVFLPASWCHPTDILLPWVEYTVNGKRVKHIFEANELKNARPGYENYYHVEFWSNVNNSDTVFLRYGNYNCRCDDPELSKRAEICPTSEFAVEYNPTVTYDQTTKKSQKEVVLAFILNQGTVRKIPKSIMQPLRANMVTSKINLDKSFDFWVDKAEYTRPIGINAEDIVWKFPDSTVRYGWAGRHTISLSDEKIKTFSGDIKVTIKDNLGKFVVITKKITATK